MKKLFPILALASLLAACGKETEAKMKAGVEQTKDAISKAVSDFEKTSDESLSKIDTQIAELRAKSKNASESVRAEIDESLAGLEKERKAMGEKLTELKTTAPEKAKELLEKAKTSLASLQKSAQDAIQRYQ